MSIKYYKTEELVVELKRREKEKYKKPDTLDFVDININRLKSMCENYIDHLESTGNMNLNTKNRIYEIAMETFYGIDIWEWICYSTSKKNRT